MYLVNETTFDKIDLPERIYKYRSWEKAVHKRLLTHNEIFFAAPLDLDEQHECRLPIDYDWATEERVYRYCYMTAPAHGFTTEEDRDRVAKYMMKHSPFFNKDHRLKVEEAGRQVLNRRLSIFSASKHRNIDSLWGSFGGGHRGFCVGLNTRKIFDNKEIFGGGGKVEYYPLSSPPSITPFQFTDTERIATMMKVIFNLPDMYQNEDEYRLIKMDLINKRAVIDPDAIEEIIIAEHIKDDHKKEIISIARDRFPHAQLLQAKYDFASDDYSFSKL